jgi:hypothetical protein
LHRHAADNAFQEVSMRTLYLISTLRVVVAFTLVGCGAENASSPMSEPASAGTSTAGDNGEAGGTGGGGAAPVAGGNDSGGNDSGGNDSGGNDSGGNAASSGLGGTAGATASAGGAAVAGGPSYDGVWRGSTKDSFKFAFSVEGHSIRALATFAKAHSSTGTCAYLFANSATVDVATGDFTVPVSSVSRALLLATNTPAVATGHLSMDSAASGTLVYQPAVILCGGLAFGSYPVQEITWTATREPALDRTALQTRCTTLCDGVAAAKCAMDDPGSCLATCVDGDASAAELFGCSQQFQQLVACGATNGLACDATGRAGFPGSCAAANKALADCTQAPATIVQ